MVDISAIPGLLSSLKILKEFSQATLEIRDNVAFRERLIEVQPKIIDAYNAAIAAQEELSVLRKRLVELKTWETEKKRYKLVDHGGGTYTYSLRPEKARGEPFHRICASCYQDGKKSILQNAGGKANGRDRFECPACQRMFYLGIYTPPPTPKVITSRSR